MERPEVPRRQSCSPSLNSNPDHDRSWSPGSSIVASYPVNHAWIRRLCSKTEPGLAARVSPVCPSFARPCACVCSASAALYSTRIQARQAAHACAFRLPPPAFSRPKSKQPAPKAISISASELLPQLTDWPSDWLAQLIIGPILLKQRGLPTDPRPSSAQDQPDPEPDAARGTRFELKGRPPGLINKTSTNLPDPASPASLKLPRRLHKGLPLQRASLTLPLPSTVRSITTTKADCPWNSLLDDRPNTWVHTHAHD